MLRDTWPTSLLLSSGHCKQPELRHNDHYFITGTFSNRWKYGYIKFRGSQHIYYLNIYAVPTMSVDVRFSFGFVKTAVTGLTYPHMSTIYCPNTFRKFYMYEKYMFT